jgi:enterochelin esterase-like enzyme
LPWYCDHPTDSTIRQESYFMNAVVPFIEKNYPANTKPDSRLLLGFSKSGWGAWSLLLRHPESFGRAAAWDAPMMTEQLGKYGTTPVFGTQENFEKYRITDLLRTNGHLLGTNKRLILTGQGNFQPEHERVHALMNDLKIPHEYRAGELRKHDWHSGWVPEAVELLLEARRQN